MGAAITQAPIAKATTEATKLTIVEATSTSKTKAIAVGITTRAAATTTTTSKLTISTKKVLQQQ